ncbi:MAG UNVERIFIED_CONTAM: hypothetical protein LVR29_09595 [Microcystis novacekii LVE1205-3]|jgi:hypothetical protein
MINSLIGSVIGGLFLIAFPVQASPKLRVGVYVSPPYVIENQVLTVNDISSLNKPSPSPKSSDYPPKAQTKFDGISIEIWQRTSQFQKI